MKPYEKKDTVTRGASLINSFTVSCVYCIRLSLLTSFHHVWEVGEPQAILPQPAAHADVVKAIQIQTITSQPLLITGTDIWGALPTYASRAPGTDYTPLLKNSPKITFSTLP